MTIERRPLLLILFLNLKTGRVLEMVQFEEQEERVVVLEGAKIKLTGN